MLLNTWKVGVTGLGVRFGMGPSTASQEVCVFSGDPLGFA